MQDVLTETAIALAATPPSCPEAASECVFCDIVAGRAPAVIVATWPEAIAFVPLNPVAIGHTLVVPKRHVIAPHEDLQLYKMVSGCAAEFAGLMDSAYNLIDNFGEDASQSVDHLHKHIVPRFWGDGLQLPWSHQYRPANHRHLPTG